MKQERYRSFAELAQNEREGIDYQIRCHQRPSTVAIVAAHGGKIVPGTSEIAEAIAAERFSFYAFEGIKRGHNAVLRLNLDSFDEPGFLSTVAGMRVIVMVRGSDDLTLEYVGVTGGGQLKHDVAEALRDAKFEVVDMGDAPTLHLDLSSALRLRLKEGTSDLDGFATVVRHALLPFDYTPTPYNNE